MYICSSHHFLHPIPKQSYALLLKHKKSPVKFCIKISGFLIHSMPPERIEPPLIILSPPPLTPSGSLESSFPIVTISIIGILATAILLLSYYAFVTKCCLNWQQSNTISQLYLSRLRRSHHSEDILTLQYSDMLDMHGLDELTIQAIPTFRYQRGQVQGCSNECAVCLNDFKEGERVRLLPNCLHVFHIDCIDAWLQTHANCPVCRSEITTTEPIAINSIIEENPSQNSAEMESNVIEMKDDEAQISNDDGNDERIAEQRLELRNGRKQSQVSSMGDECIDRRSKGGEFGVQPMRRSFSMDSSNNRQLYIVVQEILQNNSYFQMASSGEGSSSGSSARVRRSFFSFGHSCSSKNAVLPIQHEL